MDCILNQQQKQQSGYACAFHLVALGLNLDYPIYVQSFSSFISIPHLILKYLKTSKAVTKRDRGRHKFFNNLFLASFSKKYSDFF